MNWLNNGQSVKVPVGNYRIFFKELEGFQTPTNVVVTVSKNETTNVDVEYLHVSDGPWGDRGIFGSAYQNLTKIIDYVSIATISNATMFGEATNTWNGATAFSNGVLGVFSGYPYSGGFAHSQIEYITISTLGNSNLFGYLLTNRMLGSSCGSSERGIIYAARGSTNAYSTIEYITIAILSNAILFGNAGTAYRTDAAGGSDNTRGVFGGGYSPTTSRIDYITIATLGDAKLFGNLTNARRLLAACSNETRCVFAGGSDGANRRIDYITIATLGNAITFGDLTRVAYNSGGACDKIYGLFGGSSTDSIINYITMSTTANASVFGYLTKNGSTAACSGN